MAMTFDQYIANPLGKRNAVLSAITRESIRKDYTNRFNNILLRENGIINYTTYKSKENDYIIHIKIPSEVVKKFYYDVVIRFYTDENVSDMGRSLDKYNIQVFSNDPAFVFTHAYVFKQNDLFFDALKSKMGKRPLKQAPEITNPGKQLAYVKSLYFAYLFMKNRNLFKVISWADAAKFSIKTLLPNIMSADEKIALRQEEGKKISRKNQIILDKETAKKLHHMKNLSDESKSTGITTTKKTSSVRKTKTISSTKRSKVTK
jgi:hypothetical protein